MERRKFTKIRLYLMSFIIGTILFIGIFLLSYSISYTEYERISRIQGELAYKIFADKLEYSLFNQECNNASLQKISEDLYFHGGIISDLETRLGKNNKDVLFQKKFYTLVLLEHFEFIKTMNEKCNSNINTILFFYSNNREDIQESEQLGRMLTLIGRKSQNTFIYSFDINLQEKLIKQLIKQHNITRHNTIIINENKKLIEPKHINEIEKYLNQQNLI